MACPWGSGRIEVAPDFVWNEIKRHVVDVLSIELIVCAVGKGRVFDLYDQLNGCENEQPRMDREDTRIIHS